MKLLCRILGHRKLVLPVVDLPSLKVIEEPVYCTRCGERVA